jgi:hypothetical protein
VEGVALKVSELASVLSRLELDSEIGMERSRATDIPGVIEVELFELGIKKHAMPDWHGLQSRSTYLLYATTKVAASSPSPESPVESAASSPSPESPVESSLFTPQTSARRRGLMESQSLVRANGKNQT